MKNACGFALVVALCLGCSSESSKDKPKPGSGKAAAVSTGEGTPGHTFVRMHELMRDGDVDALWALYSAEMKEGMVMKIRVLLDMTDEAVMKNFGVTKEELRAKRPIEAYRLILSTPAMRKKLSGKPVPSIDSVVNKATDLVQLLYKDSAGAKCRQQERNIDGSWLIDRAPICARPKPKAAE